MSKLIKLQEDFKNRFKPFRYNFKIYRIRFPNSLDQLLCQKNKNVQFLLRIGNTYESANPFDDDQKWDITEVTGDPLAIVVERAVNKRRQKFIRQEIDKLADRFAGMGVHDNYDPMDTSNLADGSVVFTDGNGNEYVCYATRSIKKK